MPENRNQNLPRDRSLFFSKPILLLGFISLFGDIASEMIYPILPIYLATNLGATPLMIGAIEGLADFISQISKFFFGWFSERTGRKRVFIWNGYLLSAFGKALIGFTTNWSHVLGLRSMDRLGKGLRTAARDALLAESSPSHRRAEAFSIHRSMDSLGAFIGPLLALACLPIFYAEPSRFFLIALIPALISVVLVFWIPEKEQAQSESKRLSFLKLTRPGWIFVSIWAFFCLINSSNVFLLMLLKEQGHSLKTIILLYAFYNVTHSIAAPILGTWADRFGAFKVLFSGLLLFTVSYVMFSQNLGLVATAIAFFIYGLFEAATDGIGKSIFSNFIDSEKKASAMGFYSTLVGLCTLFANLIAGLVWQNFGPPVVFIYGGIGALLTSGLIGFLYLKKKA